MSDIVEKLRTDVHWHMRRQNWTIAADCKEAADEIERLRAGLLTASRQIGEWAEAMGKTVDERDRLRAAIAAPPGWVLVPVEPTPEMLKAACYRTEEAGDEGALLNWQGMLAAAPDAQKGAQPRQVDAWNAGKETGQAAERKAAAQECLSILLDGRYWNGAPQIAYQGASDRAAEIRRVFGL